LLTIRLKAVDAPAPFYRLQLVQSPLQLAQFGTLETLPPPQNFDSQLVYIQFSLQSGNNLEVDCKAPEPSPIPGDDPPVIDYLAKDYASFRQLMLDRLTITMPAWKERSPADIGVMLVEILAYAADQLSYYQDAVATEAYLGTARRRMSVRRHARLLDYFMHDGCNARTWVVLEVEPHCDGLSLPGPSPKDNRPGIRFFTRIPGLPDILNPRDFQRQDLISKALNSEAEVFESMVDVTLYEPCNTIYLYTWGEENSNLPVGATQATLKDTGGQLRRVSEC
jgi:predicted phage baseplate assembly protein